jgi:hypothetical protein
LVLQLPPPVAATTACCPPTFRKAGGIAAHGAPTFDEAW